MIIVDLIYNLTLLVAMSVISGFLDLRWKRSTLQGALMQGVLFGTAGVIGMMRPFVMAPGLIFDGRSVMVSLCGLFFGPWAAGLAGLMTAAYRVYIGGSGALTGVSVITSSALIGAAGYFVRKRQGLQELRSWQLLIFGISVHIAMLLIMFTLGWNAGLNVLKTIALPVIITYPAATVLIGKILSDQENRGRSLQLLQESEERFRSMAQQIADVLFTSDDQGVITYISPSCAQIFGWTPEEMTGQLFDRYFPEDQAATARKSFQEAVLEGIPLVNLTMAMKHKNGHTFIGELNGTRTIAEDGKRGTVGTIRDITQRKQMEEEREVTVKLLGLINSSNELHELLQEVTSLLHEWSGCEAVGIRLKEGEDYPYFVTRGFPAHFVEAERMLCAHDAQGEIVRDFQGNPVLECMCGNILCGRFNPALPFFTPYGSFWTNSTTRLLASTSEADRQARTRNRCNGEGYESVALIPLRAGGTTFGLLQINDSQQGRFTLQKIELYERLAENLAIALAQRQAQKALRESEASLLTLFEHSPFAIFEEDFSEVKKYFQQLAARGIEDLSNYFNAHPEEVRRCAGLIKIRRMNQTSVRTFGVQSKEEIPNSLQGIYTPESYAVFKEVLAKGALHHQHEIPLQLPGGQRRIFSVHMSVVPGSEQDLSRVLVSFVDITEKKHAEEALRENEKLLRNIIDSSTDYIFVKDRQLRTVICNQTFASAVGKTPAELVGKSDIENGWGEEFVKGNAEKGIRGYEADDLRVLQGEAIHVREAGMVGGSMHYFDTIKLPLRNEEGEIIGVCGVSRDITERVEAEQALQDSEAKMREAQEIAHVGSWQFDVATQKSTWSAEMFRIFGLDATAGEPTYDEFQHLFQADDWKILEEAIQTAIHTGKGYTLEARILRPDGEMRHILTICKTTQGSDGRTIGLNGTVQDITERKQMTEKIIQAQKLADLGTLAAGVAHEINSPLQIITGSSENILGKLKTGEIDVEGMQRRVERIHQNAWRIANIVRSLLTYARSNQDQITETNLNALVNDTLLLTEHQIRVWSNIEVITDLAADLPEFICDRNKITQVIINLLTNARDAMPTGGRVTLRTFFDKTTQRVGLQVSDTGQGIPENLKSRIFDPFFTTKPLGQGTGLGLSIVQGIVHAHGGEIRVSSQTGHGSVFTLFFPLAPPRPPEQPAKNLDEFYPWR